MVSLAVCLEAGLFAGEETRANLNRQVDAPVSFPFELCAPRFFCVVVVSAGFSAEDFPVFRDAKSLAVCLVCLHKKEPQRARL